MTPLRGWGIWVALLVCACGDGGAGSPDAMICPGNPSACDDHNPCTTDHASVNAECVVTCTHDTVPNCCGNGVVEGTEICDDGNVAPLDGCSPQCTYERALAMDSIGFNPPGGGCDLNNDGIPDEAVNAAMNDAARGYMSSWLSNDLHKQPRVVLLTFTDLSDATAQAGAFSFSMIQGVDLEVDPMYFSGHEPFHVTSMFIDPQRGPTATIGVMASAGLLSTTAPGTVLIPYPLVSTYTFRLDRVRLEAAIATDGIRPTELTVGRMCGAFAAPSMSTVGTPFLSGSDTMLDSVALGDQFLSFRVIATQPDIDIDGDGLETFFDDDGDRKVDHCVDGNGAQIFGIACPTDPRIADGYSMTLTLHGVGAVLAGMAP